MKKHGRQQEQGCDIFTKSTASLLIASKAALVLSMSITVSPLQSYQSRHFKYLPIINKLLSLLLLSANKELKIKRSNDILQSSIVCFSTFVCVFAKTTSHKLNTIEIGSCFRTSRYVYHDNTKHHRWP